jgi:amino acid adenylation domain-containing protein
MFILQNVPLTELELPELKVSNLSLASRTEKFELTLAAIEQGGRIQGQISYRKDLFEESGIRRLLGHWENLMTEIVADAGRPVAELQLLTRVERRQLLVEWNRTEDRSVVGQRVHELFLEQVRRTPDAVAVVYEGERMTYGELNRRTNQLARYLRRMGVEAERRVGLCLGRGINMVAGLVAIWKAGGAYVPIDAGYPRERVEYILKDAGCEVVVTERELWRCLWGEEERGSGKWKKRVLCLDEEWEEISKEKEKGLEGERGDAENLAYVIYTSGSTGKPKGVEIEHRQLMNYLASIVKKLETREGSSYATVSTLAADLGNTMIFPALTSGGSLHVIAEDRILDGERLGDYFEEEGIECLKIVPSHLVGLQSGGGGKRVLPQKILVVGGEASNWKWVERWQEEGRGCRVINHYGPTETTVGVLTYGIEAGVAEGRGREENVPLGRPLENTQVFVLDEEMEPAPVGVAGELYIGGAGLARGYTGKGDMTGERFVPNQFSQVGGERLYRTGDRVKWRRDGELEFLGRQDYQVKLRGYRVELGEIEGALGSNADVEQAAVVVRDEEGGGEKRLIAYVVLKGGERKRGGLNGKEGIVKLRNYLKERLPEYMVPGAIVVLDEMPVTPNGKLDRTALRKPEAGVETEREEAILRDAQQEILSGIFAEALKREKVGVEENFFEMGGHSLLATLVMSRVRKVFGVEIPLRALFESPTVRGLAERVTQARGGELARSLPLALVERSGDLPLSYAQQRLWFVDQLEPGKTTYNVLYGLRLIGDLDWPALKRSIQEMVRRHEILRTRFPERDGIPVQEIAVEDWQIKEIDLRAVAEEERAAKAEMLAREEAGAPFDLAKGPLLRVTLLRLGTHEHVLLVAMHHIVSDEWSRGVIIREICLLYQAYVKGEESPLPDLEIQYADFASWQRRWLQGEVLERQMKYWKRQLAELPALNLPTDRKRPAVIGHSGGKMSFELPRHLTDQLKALSRREGVTLFMTLLAAFQVLLQKYTGQQDIAVGSLVANRDRAETQALIGFFANIVVLRIDLSGRPSFADVLGRVRDVTLEAFDHQDLPFEMVVNAVRSHKPFAGSLVQAVLSMHKVSTTSLQLAGLQTRTFELNYTNDYKFDLLLHIEESNEDLQGKWEYSFDLFESEAIEQMSRHFLQLISNILQDPSASIDDLQLLSHHEVQLLSQHTEKDEFVSGDFSF